MKKLSLNKVVLSSLDKKEMNLVKGGGPKTKICVPELTEIDCDDVLTIVVDGQRTWEYTCTQATAVG